MSDLAVLFDLDGVIVDSREHHLAAWERWAREYDIAHPPSYFHEMFGRRNDAIIGRLLTRVRPAELQRMADRKEALFRDTARGRLVALPGVMSLLKWLGDRAIPSAIVTSTPRANLDMILDDLGLAGRFKALVAEEDASRGKPDPEGFLVAAERIGAVPRRCIVIEDAPAGLEAAKAGGMRAIGVTTTHDRAALGPADVVVASLDEPAVLEFMRQAQVDGPAT